MRFSPKKFSLALSFLLALGMAATYSVYQHKAELTATSVIDADSYGKWVVTEFGPNPAEAQAIAGAVKNGTGGWGRVMPCWNTIDSTILSGTLVMWDTTTAAIGSGGYKRLAVRPYDGTLSNRKRVAGWCFGDVSKSSQGGRGAIIVEGYVPDMKISVGTAVAGQIYRVGTLHGAVKDGSDSVSMQVAYCLGATSGFAGSRYTIKAWAYPLTPKIIGSL